MCEISIIEQTDQTVTISRKDWEILLDRLKNQQDRQASAASQQALSARVTYTAEETRRMISEDVSPVRILRERQGLTQAALAERISMSKPYLNEIERGRKPGSAEAIKHIAAALKVSMEDLLV